MTGGKTISTGFSVITLSSGRDRAKCVCRSYGLGWAVFFVNVGTKELLAGLLGFLTCEEEPAVVVFFCGRDVFVVSTSDRSAFAWLSRVRNSAIFIWMPPLLLVGAFDNDIFDFFFFFFFSRFEVLPNSIPSSRPFAAARAKTSFTDTASDGSRYDQKKQLLNVGVNYYCVYYRFSQCFSKNKSIFITIKEKVFRP